MGFSVLGLVVSLAIFAPSLLLVVFPARPRLESFPTPLVLQVFERVGQVLCVTVPAATAPGGVVWWAVVPTALAVAVYWALWGRYLLSGCARSTLFDAVRGVPVPMALAPVLALFAAAVWLQNPWIAASAGILAIGHIPTSVIAARHS